MYKFVLESFCSCRYGKSALTFKSLNIVQTSYCVRRFSKKWNAPYYINEEGEHHHRQEHGSRSKSRSSYTSPHSRTYEYNTRGYEKHAKPLNEYDGNRNDERRFSKNRHAPNYIDEQREHHRRQHQRDWDDERFSKNRSAPNYMSEQREHQRQRHHQDWDNERFSKNRSMPDYINEEGEQHHKQEYGSRSKPRSSYSTQHTRTYEYNTRGYEKHANKLNNYDGNRDDENRFSKNRSAPNYINEQRELWGRQSEHDLDNEMKRYPESDTFGGGVGEFQELSEYDNKLGPSVRKSRKNQSLPPNWANEFGTLGPAEDEPLTDKKDEDLDLEDDEREERILGHIRLARYNRPHIPNWYARRIQKLGKQGEIRKAIEVFDEWMIKRDKVKPTYFEYTVLLKLLADVGYTEKALKLYKDMLRRQIHVDGYVYTCLFNACANSPWPRYGLEHARSLRQTMLYKNIKPHYITYLAMIKAFGFCGDINTAFSIADEAALVNVSEDLLCNMLTACISDKEAGFRHAIMVWRKCRTLGIKPGLTSYNLLFRCVNECGIGDPDLVKRLFNQPINVTESKSNNRHLVEGVKHTEVTTDAEHVDMTENNSSDNYNVESSDKNLFETKKRRIARKSFAKFDQLMVRHGFDNEVTDQDVQSQEDVSDTNNEISSETSVIEDNRQWWEQDIFENTLSTLPVQETETTLMALSNDKFPDILNPNEDFRFLVDVTALKGKHDRLDLLGGMNGVLQTLQAKRIKPTIVTFSLLSKSIREDSVDFLISKMWAMGVKPDIVFYNHCIREYAPRNPELAWALFKRMTAEELVPDIRTYSLLAIACRDRDQGLQLIDDMLNANIMPNAYTIYGLLADTKLDFDYKVKILQVMDEHGIQCDSKLVERLENDIQRARMILLKREQKSSSSENLTDADEKYANYTKTLRKRLDRFSHFYDKWLKRQKMAMERHPWEAFRPLKEDETNM